MGNKVQELWDYYKDAAKLLGARKRGEGAEQADESRSKPEGQMNYSVMPFYNSYQNPAGELNDITLAFMGDDAASQRLEREEPLPRQWEDGLLEAEEGRTINVDQKEAIKKALGSAVSVIVGPPGTGKTETILNLLSCIGRQGKTAAVVSGANSAVDDIFNKIQEHEDPEQKNRTWLKGHFARLGCQKNKREFKKAHQEVTFQNAETFLKKFPLISSTIHSLRNCFEDGGKYCYDYVIVDEVSQVNPVVGLLAMSAAGHLVLVGDQKQLPPVIQVEKLKELENREIPDEYRIKNSRSFLDVCKEVLSPKGLLSETELTFHYRCHPDIIEFCNRIIYQNKLKLEKPFGHGPRVPIKVLWFEGDYQDKVFKESKTGEVRPSKKNRKQALIFMEEEWPEVKRRFQKQKEKGEEPESICILTPFKGQVLELQRLLKEDIQKNKIEDITVTIGGEETDDEGQGQTFPVLTIHKSQGREYDSVYLLPVDDEDWLWTWSQKMQLVNVAVSRAKKELHLILSASLMEYPIQMELTKRYIPPKGTRDKAEATEDGRYIQKLTSYVKERAEEAGVRRYPNSDCEFGFHQTCRRSVYDQNAWIQFTETAQRKSAPEQCMRQALEDMCRDWKAVLGVELSVHGHVELKRIKTWTGETPKLDAGTLDELLSIAFWKDMPLLQAEGAPEKTMEGTDLVPEDPDVPDMPGEIQKLVDNGGHLDFVICYGDRVLAAIEVDGAGHRRPMERKGKSIKEAQKEYERQKLRDQAKDDLLRKVFGAGCYTGNVRSENPALSARSVGAFAFIRLPTDGSTCLETMRLWSNAPKEFQDKYFPIEELIKAQLLRRNFAREGRAYRLPAEGAEMSGESEVSTAGG